MGKRRGGPKQEPLFYASERKETPGHPFDQRLSRVLTEGRFDEFCEKQCAKFFHQRLGRPSTPPGMTCSPKTGPG